MRKDFFAPTKRKLIFPGALAPVGLSTLLPQAAVRSTSQFSFSVRSFNEGGYLHS